MNALLLAAALAVPAPAAVTRARWVMGTICEVTAEGPRADQAVAAALAEISHWDRVLSLYKKESEASRFNAQPPGKPFSCSQDFWDELVAARRAYENDEGAFDVTVLPVLRRGPAALASVGFFKLRMNDAKREATFLAVGMGVDFGGIGKGLALDRAAAAMKKAGATAGFLNFGGQLLGFGRPWPARVPGRPEIFLLQDASMSTSGNAERPGHIVSPLTGEKIARTEEATVILPSAADADAASTAVFILGRPPKNFPGCAIFSNGKSLPSACRRYASKEPSS